MFAMRLKADMFDGTSADASIDEYLVVEETTSITACLDH